MRCNSNKTSRALFLSSTSGALVLFASKGVAQAAGPSTVDGRFTAENNVWFNSPPLSRELLRGKVILVNFWTYSCINSLRALPYVETWAQKYKPDGLVVIGAHTPEFSFEKDRANVGRAVGELKLTYPVVMDSDYRIWNAFGNEYWPAFYLVDGAGRVRYHFFGEGEYTAIERDLQTLLAEDGDPGVNRTTAHVSGRGIEAAASDADAQSPETYVGYTRAERFASPEGLVRNVQTNYVAPANLRLNEWALVGSWNAGTERAVLQTAPGRVRFRFHSRDLHFVLGPARDGKPVRFRVTLDGRPPSVDCGADCAPNGYGVVREPRLYQLIRQKAPVVDRTFEIEFLDAGVQAYDFTFG
jgi:thiol-disulfide isomerase/thioredoxin